MTDTLTPTIEETHRIPLKRGWAMGANTCHAPIVMRSDLQTQMRRVHEELGFRYWRAHGTLSDDVSVFTEYPDGQCYYTFSGLKRILDAVLASGLKPFLELSFMPTALSRDPEKTITHYQGPTEPPKDFAQWENLIRETGNFLMETYGEAELSTWYFVYWNLSDIYEECKYHFAPFHGGYGLLTVDDIAKSAFRCFEFFERLEEFHLPIEGLPETAERGAMGSINEVGDRITLLLWNSCSHGDWTVCLQAPKGFAPKQLDQILPGQGSAYEAWLEMGRPMNLTQAQQETLTKASIPLSLIDWEPENLILPAGSVALVQFVAS